MNICSIIPYIPYHTVQKLFRLVQDSTNIYTKPYVIKCHVRKQKLSGSGDIQWFTCQVCPNWQCEKCLTKRIKATDDFYYSEECAKKAN